MDSFKKKKSNTLDIFFYLYVCFNNKTIFMPCQAWSQEGHSLRTEKQLWFEVVGTSGYFARRLQAEHVVGALSFGL